MRVVVAGQMPPPVGGQNINTKRVFDLLSEEGDLRVEHLRFEFTKTWDQARRAGIGKVAELGRVVLRALRLRRAGKIDVILYPSGGPHLTPILRDLVLLPFLALLTGRLVVHFRAAGIAECLARSNPLLRAICRFVYSRCCDEAIVLADYGRRDPEAVGITKVSVIPNSFEDLAGGAYARERSEKVDVLSVGHLCADKGTPELIAAFGAIGSKELDLNLVLVGEPLAPYTEEQLRADISATGLEERIRWEGLLHGDELAAAYRAGDVFVFASVAPYESFGMVLIEAMQWSLPLVVTDWRANLEVCGEGFGGTVARNPTEDGSKGLENALREALAARPKWDDWGRTNRATFEARYTIGKLRENLVRFLRGPKTEKDADS